MVPLYFDYEGDTYKRTSIVGENCTELNDFTLKFIEWTQVFSDFTPKPPPLCECEDGVCHIELTEYFPNFVQKKIFRDINSHGPNCYNTTLISRGFLNTQQIRFSTEKEFLYYINTFCTSIPIESRDTNDIIVHSNIEGVFSIHGGLYIGHNLLFTKAGPIRTDRYSLEDWSGKFQFEKQNLKAFRCAALPQKKTTPQLRDLESLYSNLFHSDIAPSELHDRLNDLENKIFGFDVSHLVSEEDRLGFQCLKTSVSSSKASYVLLLLENNDCRWVPQDSINQIFKNPENPNSSSYHAGLESGDFIDLKEEITSNSEYLKQGCKYKVMKIVD